VKVRPHFGKKLSPCSAYVGYYWDTLREGIGPSRNLLICSKEIFFHKTDV
jgi:hypothetical protein